MPYFVCEEHKRVFQTYLGFIGHWRGLHKDEPRPEEADVTVEEAPEGYGFAETAKKPSRAKVAVADEEEDERAEARKKPPSPPMVPGQIPEDVMERTKLSLQVHHVPTGLTEYILNLLKMHPEAQDNSTNFANFLNWVCSTSPEGRRHTVKISMVTQEVFPQSGGEMPYVMPGGYGGQPYGYYPYSPGQTPAWGPQPPGGWLTQPQGLPPQAKAEIDELKSQLNDLSNKHNEVLAFLKEQAEKKKTDDILQAIAAISQRVDQIAQAKGGEEGGGYLKAYLDEKDKREMDYRSERDKREEEREKRAAEALEAANKRHEETLARLQSDIERAREDRDKALVEDKTRRAELAAQMKEDGWRPSEHQTKDELDHDLLKTGVQIIPGKIEQGLDKLTSTVERIIAGAPRAGDGPPAPKKPRSIDDVARQAELENSLLEKIGP